ncbi:MAG TPA: R3H domain-containing nucleic acid-binding protein [Candidatus Bathyarchaeia archaeon]|nr:R3H domain-containing nucleic acid-binding protein [Candidatus Bathyarchaeia archaeon]
MASKADSKKSKRIIKESIQGIIDNLEIEAVIKLKEDEKGVKVTIETPEAGYLIGRHGETLNALQYLLKVIVYNQTGEFPPLEIDIADYRRNREKILQSMVASAAKRVKLTGKPVALSPMSSYERRITHLIITLEKDVFSESEGEGDERKVVVKPKTGKTG